METLSKNELLSVLEFMVWQRKVIQNKSSPPSPFYIFNASFFISAFLFLSCVYLSVQKMSPSCFFFFLSVVFYLLLVFFICLFVFNVQMYLTIHFIPTEKVMFFIDERQMYLSKGDYFTVLISQH